MPKKIQNSTMDLRKNSIAWGTPGPADQALRSVSPKALAGELRDAGLAGPSGPVHLEMVPGNPDRHDFGTRVSFRVFRARRPVCFLTLGRNLRDLWMRTQNFAKACPEIACKPLFHRKTHRWDLVGVEYFDGTDLESLVSREEITTDAALALAESMAGALRRTRKPSHIEAAAREFDHFSADLLSSAIFDGLDQGFLRDVVLPFVRSGALKGPLSTQWSNGDFIARNILVDPKGALRLIDLEFASRTHFHGDDWWRWRTYSRLPTEVGDFPALRDNVPHEPWLEVYFMLRQVLLAEKVNGARLAVAEAQENMARMVAIIASAHLNFRSSIIYSHLAGADSRPSTLPPKGTVEAQIFWSPSGRFSEEESKRTEYGPNEDNVIRFTVKAPSGRLQLRLDPAAMVGMVRISSIRVRGNGSETALYSASGPEDWGRIEVGGGALRLADTPELNLLCLDTDPWMLLPVIEDVSCFEAIACEVALRFSSELRALPDLLQLPALPDHEAVRELASLKERIAAHSTKLDTRDTEVMELRKDVSTAATQLDERLDEIAGLKAHINELESRLADEQRRESGEIEELRSTLAARTAEDSAKAGQVSELMSSLSERERDLADLTARLANESKEHSEARVHLGLATQHCRNLEAELEKLRTEVKLRGSALDKAHSKLADMEGRKSTCEGEIAMQRDRISTISREKAAMEDQRAELEERLRVAKADATDARHHLGLATQHAANLESQVARLRVEAERREEALALANEGASRLKEAFADLEGRLRVESAEVKHARARLGLSAKQVEELEAQLSMQRRDAASIAERLESSNSEVLRLRELQSEKSRLQAQAAARERRIAELEEQATLAEAKKQEHARKQSALHEANAALTERIGALESDAEKARSSQDALTESLLAQNRAIMETENRAALFMEEHESRLREAAENEATLRAALETTKTELNELQARLDAIGRRPLVRFDAALRGKALPNLSADKS